MHCIAGTGLAVFVFLGTAAAAPVAVPIFTFASTHGGFGALAADASGNVYGALPNDGPTGSGQVYRLAPPASPGGAWIETILYSFDGTLGSNPIGGVFLAADGSLIVTAAGGGPSGAGSVVRLSPSASGPWTASLIYAFTGAADGGSPQAAVIGDAAGNFFGTTFSGGKSAKGAVVEISPAPGGGFTETVLYSFTGGMDGAGPMEPLTMDAGGNLFGATESGGGSSECSVSSYQGCGTAFALARSGSSPTAWVERVIARYSGYFPLGAFPGALTLHGAHNLVGTAFDGAVYALVPAGPAPVTWSEQTIYTFPTSRQGAAAHGTDPDGNVVTTPSGNLIGSTVYGGTVGYGGLYVITPPTGGHGGSQTLFYSYPGFSQSYPNTDILVAPSGLLYQNAGNQMLQITPD